MWTVLVNTGWIAALNAELRTRGLDAEIDWASAGEYRLTVSKEVVAVTSDRHRFANNLMKRFGCDDRWTHEQGPASECEWLTLAADAGLVIRTANGWLPTMAEASEPAGDWTWVESLGEELFNAGYTLLHFENDAKQLQFLWTDSQNDQDYLYKSHPLSASDLIEWALETLNCEVAGRPNGAHRDGVPRS